MKNPFLENFRPYIPDATTLRELTPLPLVVAPPPPPLLALEPQAGANRATASIAPRAPQRDSRRAAPVMMDLL